MFLLLAVGVSVGGYVTHSARAQSRQILTHVTDIQCTIQQQQPILVVTVRGEIPAKGYQEPLLTRRKYPQPPADGIQEYDFTAVTPDGVEKKIIKQPEATDKWAAYAHEAPWLKGVRIYGVADGIKEETLQACEQGK
jgi:hypothetical protein